MTEFIVKNYLLNCVNMVLQLGESGVHVKARGETSKQDLSMRTEEDASVTA